MRRGYGLVIFFKQSLSKQKLKRGLQGKCQIQTLGQSSWQCLGIGQHSGGSFVYYCWGEPPSKWTSQISLPTGKASKWILFITRWWGLFFPSVLQTFTKPYSVPRIEFSTWGEKDIVFAIWTVVEQETSHWSLQVCYTVSMGVFSSGREWREQIFLPKPEDRVGVGQVKCLARCVGGICRECVCWGGVDSRQRPMYLRNSRETSLESSVTSSNYVCRPLFHQLITIDYPLILIQLTCFSLLLFFQLTCF